MARPRRKRTSKATPAQKAKVKTVMEEWEKGTLHSGSKKGPIVRSQKQAIAIALSQSGQSRKRRRSRRK